MTERKEMTHDIFVVYVNAGSSAFSGFDFSISTDTIMVL